MGRFGPSLPIVVLTETLENANAIALLNPMVFAQFAPTDIHAMALAVQNSGLEVDAGRIYAIRKTLPAYETGIWVGTNAGIW